MPLGLARDANSARIVRGKGGRGDLVSWEQRERLMPFVGNFVRATGPVYERGGTRAIGVQQVTEMKEVQLVTDAK